MALHPMLIHFPIALIYVGTFAAIAGTILYLFKGELSKKEQEKIKKSDYLGKIDFVVYLSILITFFGLMIVIYTGFLDAAKQSKTTLIDLFKPWEVITGFHNALQSKFLTFKMTFAITVFFLTIILIIMRSYYLRRANVKSIFDLDIISLLAIDLLTFTVMGIITLVGSVGGTYMYGHSILQNIPFVNLFLPTSYGFILLPIAIIGVLIVEGILLFAERRYPNVSINSLHF